MDIKNHFVIICLSSTGKTSKRKIRNEENLWMFPILEMIIYGKSSLPILLLN